MNEFKRAVEQAKNHQHRKMMWYVTSSVAIIFIISIMLFVSRGTRVEVLPEVIKSQASVSVTRGIAIVIYGYLYSLSSAAEIEVKAQGYIKSRKVLTRENFGEITTVTLKPMPSEIILTSSTSDQKTSWQINDQLVAVANSIHKTVEAGDYSLTVNHPYFKEKTLSYVLTGGTVINETIELEPIDIGIQINSSPSDASVIVDGIKEGKTPLFLTLLGGVHQIEVIKHGYDSTYEQLELKNTSKEVIRNYNLLAKSAGVTVSVLPVDGTMRLNGISVSTKDKIKVNAGQKNILSYEKSGYFSHSETFNLKADQTKHIDFELEEEMGTLEIISTPPSTNVFINGKSAGKTPLILSLKAVAHKVELTLIGYRSLSFSVTPSASKPSKINANLIYEAEARLKDAPTTYKTHTGGEMVLFKPNDQVVMGALRSELGQRANEFIRTVNITKPFYAGRYEVTNGAYAKFNAVNTGSPSIPVTSITWLDAVHYANWLSQNESFTPVYIIEKDTLTRINPLADGYRLLTEAEWEWLARKAERKQQTQFVWGDNKTIPKKAGNIADESVKGVIRSYVPRYNDGYAGVAPVMSMLREKSGLYDMGGNVSEWVHDSYSLTLPGKNQILEQILDPKILGMRVVKGASYKSGTLTELRGSYREGQVQARDDLGFRLGRYL